MVIVFFYGCSCYLIRHNVYVRLTDNNLTLNAYYDHSTNLLLPTCFFFLITRRHCINGKTIRNNSLYYAAHLLTIGFFFCYKETILINYKKIKYSSYYSNIIKQL